MSDQANALRGLMEHRIADPALPAEPLGRLKARTIAVTSGKGGVGKSNIALNLSVALAALDADVCLLDANLGLGNIDLLCGLNGYWNLSHVITGARMLRDVVLHGPGGIDVIPGASGLHDIADCPPSAQNELLCQLEELERTHDFIIIDTGTGIHRPIRRFVAEADVALVVTTPEPTSIADAYATFKALSAVQDLPRLEVVVNQADSAQQAHAIVERLQKTARLFLQVEISAAGYIFRDHHVPAAVVRRTPFVIDSPHAPASRSIQQLARRIKNLTATHALRGSFFPRIWQHYVQKAA